MAEFDSDDRRSINLIVKHPEILQNSVKKHIQEQDNKIKELTNQVIEVSVKNKSNDLIIKSYVQDSAKMKNSLSSAEKELVKIKKLNEVNEERLKRLNEAKDKQINRLTEEITILEEIIKAMEMREHEFQIINLPKGVKKSEVSSSPSSFDPSYTRKIDSIEEKQAKYKEKYRIFPDRIVSGKIKGRQPGHEAHFKDIINFEYKEEIIEVKPEYDEKNQKIDYSNEKIHQTVTVSYILIGKVTKINYHIGTLPNGKKNYPCSKTKLSNKVSYDDSVKQLIKLLNYRGLIPIDRLSQTLKEIFEEKFVPSNGFIHKVLKEDYSENKKIHDKEIKDILEGDEPCHLDETTMKFGDSFRWITTISTKRVPYFLFQTEMDINLMMKQSQF